jgi:hypothetical protein
MMVSALEDYYIPSLIFIFPETKTKLVELIKIINRDFSEEFGNTVSSLGPEVTNSLQNLFTAS